MVHESEKPFTSAPFSIIQQLKALVAAAGIISLCVVTKLIASCWYYCFVETRYKHRIAFIHI